MMLIFTLILTLIMTVLELSLSTAGNSISMAILVMEVSTDVPRLFNSQFKLQPFTCLFEYYQLYTLKSHLTV